MTHRDRTLTVGRDDRRLDVKSIKDPPRPPRPVTPPPDVLSYDLAATPAEFCFDAGSAVLSQLHLLGVGHSEYGYDAMSAGPAENLGVQEAEFGWEDEPAPLTQVHMVGVDSTEFGFELTGPDDIITNIIVSPVDFDMELSSVNLTQAHNISVTEAEFGFDAFSAEVINQPRDVDVFSAEFGYEAFSVGVAPTGPIQVFEAELGYEARSVLIATPVTDPNPLVVGLNISIHIGSVFNLEGQNNTVALGTHAIRVGYMTGDHDFGINWAYNRGIGVMFQLGYGHGCDAKTPSGRQCYADRSAALAQQYGNKVTFFQIWNEWNGKFGPWGSYTLNHTRWVEYVDLVRRTYIAIKAVRPNAHVSAGPISGCADIPFITHMLDEGVGDYMDSLSVHCYPYAAHNNMAEPETPAAEAVQMWINRLKSTYQLIIQKHGSPKPLIVSEVGFHGPDTAAGLQKEADFLRILYNESGLLPYVKGVWWFNLKDFTTATHFSGHGLLTSANVKKPAYFAFQAAAAR